MNKQSHKKQVQIKPKATSPKNNLFGLKTELPVLLKYFPIFTYLCFCCHTSDPVAFI